MIVVDRNAVEHRRRLAPRAFHWHRPDAPQLLRTQLQQQPNHVLPACHAWAAEARHIPLVKQARKHHLHRPRIRPQKLLRDRKPTYPPRAAANRVGSVQHVLVPFKIGTEAFNLLRNQSVQLRFHQTVSVTPQCNGVGKRFAVEFISLRVWPRVQQAAPSHCPLAVQKPPKQIVELLPQIHWRIERTQRVHDELPRRQHVNPLLVPAQHRIFHALLSRAFARIVDSDGLVFCKVQARSEQPERHQRRPVEVLRVGPRWRQPEFIVGLRLKRFAFSKHTHCLSVQKAGQKIHNVFSALLSFHAFKETRRQPQSTIPLLHEHVQPAATSGRGPRKGAGVVQGVEGGLVKFLHAARNPTLLRVLVTRGVPFHHPKERGAHHISTLVQQLRHPGHGAASFFVQQHGVGWQFKPLYLLLDCVKLHHFAKHGHQVHEFPLNDANFKPLNRNVAPRLAKARQRIPALLDGRLRTKVCEIQRELLRCLFFGLQPRVALVHIAILSGPLERNRRNPLQNPPHDDGKSVCVRRALLLGPLLPLVAAPEHTRWRYKNLNVLLPLDGTHPVELCHLLLQLFEDGLVKLLLQHERHLPRPILKRFAHAQIPLLRQQRLLPLQHDLQHPQHGPRALHPTHKRIDQNLRVAPRIRLQQILQLLHPRRKHGRFLVDNVLSAALVRIVLVPRCQRREYAPQNDSHCPFVLALPVIKPSEQLLQVVAAVALLLRLAPRRQPAGCPALLKRALARPLLPPLCQLSLLPLDLRFPRRLHLLRRHLLVGGLCAPPRLQGPQLQQVKRRRRRRRLANLTLFDEPSVAGLLVLKKTRPQVLRASLMEKVELLCRIRAPRVHLHHLPHQRQAANRACELRLLKELHDERIRVLSQLFHLLLRSVRGRCAQVQKPEVWQRHLLAPLWGDVVCARASAHRFSFWVSLTIEPAQYSLSEITTRSLPNPRLHPLPRAHPLLTLTASPARAPRACIRPRADGRAAAPCPPCPPPPGPGSRTAGPRSVG